MKGSGGIRSPQESQSFKVFNSEGKEIPVKVTDPRQLEALKIALAKIGRPLPPTVTSIRTEDLWEDDTGGFNPYEDASGGVSNWQGLFGGSYNIDTGEVLIQCPETSVMRERFGKSMNLTSEYTHTWIHEFGHAIFEDKFRKEMGGPSTAEYDDIRGAPTIDKLHYLWQAAKSDYTVNYARMHPNDDFLKQDGGMVPMWSYPHRLDDAHEWFAENFATYIDSRHPMQRDGLSYYRTTPNMASIIKKMGYTQTTKPATKVGPWESEYHR